MINARLAHTNAHIAEYGISIHAIHPCVGETGPSFVYTVGMAAIGAPELICFGIPPQQVMPYLNMIFVEIREGKRKPGLKRDDDFWNFVTYFDEVDPKVMEDYATATFEYYEDKDVTPTFRQMVWPDRLVSIRKSLLC